MSLRTTTFSHPSFVYCNSKWSYRYTALLLLLSSAVGCFKCSFLYCSFEPFLTFYNTLYHFATRLVKVAVSRKKLQEDDIIENFEYAALSSWGKYILSHTFWPESHFPIDSECHSVSGMFIRTKMDSTKYTFEDDSSFFKAIDKSPRKRLNMNAKAYSDLDKLLEEEEQNE